MQHNRCNKSQHTPQKTQHTTHHTRNTSHTLTQHITYTHIIIHYSDYKITSSNLYIMSRPSPLMHSITPLRNKIFIRPYRGPVMKLFPTWNGLMKLNIATGKSIQLTEFFLHERTCPYQFVWYKLRFPMVYCGWVDMTSLSCLGHGRISPAIFSLTWSSTPRK